ncbi:MAG: hypothetical protein NAOJABEB_00732 [Steroidobacteraceae bacterium]|nr:hypothetical protein [Steroidobacteraceae bacterium]
MWRILRITLLGLVLFVVAATAWLDRAASREWREPLWVGLYPVAGDDDAVTADYITRLAPTPFTAIETFFAREGAGYAVPAEPVHIELHARVARMPPALAPDADWLRTAAWSLAMRWYAWRAAAEAGGAPPHVRIFVIYHAPARQDVLPHSLGLAKGLIGVVHAYADRGHEGMNAVVIAHELLHTLGATDKYDAATLLPRFPEGYAEPDRQPRHPQPLAEIMAGRRAVGAREAAMPDSLDDVVVGPATAREIAWVER